MVKSSDGDVWKDIRTSEFLPLSMEVPSVVRYMEGRDLPVDCNMNRGYILGMKI